MEILSNNNTLPSPPIILPLLPHEGTNMGDQETFHEQAVPNVREIAWTSLVDTATKATSSSSDRSNDLYDEAGAHRKLNTTSVTNPRQTKSTILQLSPANLETDVTYFTTADDPNHDISDDENDKTIMEGVCILIFSYGVNIKQRNIL